MRVTTRGPQRGKWLLVRAAAEVGCESASTPRTTLRLWGAFANERVFCSSSINVSFSLTPHLLTAVTKPEKLCVSGEHGPPALGPEYRGLEAPPLLNPSYLLPTSCEQVRRKRNAPATVPHKFTPGSSSPAPSAPPAPWGTRHSCQAHTHTQTHTHTHTHTAARDRPAGTLVRRAAGCTIAPPAARPFRIGRRCVCPRSIATCARPVKI
jgi:hypothetical protein